MRQLARLRPAFVDFALSSRRWTPAAVFGFALLLPLASALAVVPGTLQVEGVLQTQSGGAVVDGPYKLTFGLWDAETNGNKLWSETVDVGIGGGRFVATLGDTAALDPKALAGGKAWLSMAVGLEPELPRRRVSSTAYALRAGVADAVECSGCLSAGAAGFPYAGAATKGGPALDLECTGCVSTAELKFDGDLDLDGNSLKAKNATLTGDLAAKTVTAAAFVGDGSKLTGIVQPSGACKSGEAVTGIAVDGSVVCGKVASANALGGLLSNEMSEGAAAQGLPKAIGDNTGAAVTSDVTIEDVGVASALSVKVKVTNTDFSTVSVILLPPNDKAKGIVLCDPCGDKDSKLLDKTYKANSDLKSGDLAGWVGQNPKGIWTLKVLDTSFCLPQVPENKGICDATAKTDGAIVAFAVDLQVTSPIAVVNTGTFKFGVFDKAPFACTSNRMGHAYFDSAAKKLRYCDGGAWRGLADTCGDGVLQPGEECDDGNNTDSDGCTATCNADYGYGEGKPGKSCKDILDVTTAVGGKPTDGPAWIALPGLPTFKVQCDMTTLGGGWFVIPETTEFAYKVYSESESTELFKYSLSNAQIAAIKKVSSEGRQSWQCHTVGVGSAYKLDANGNKINTYGACWATNNQDEKNASGIETDVGKLPMLAWFPVDCGDSSEACQHNVGNLLLR